MKTRFLLPLLMLAAESHACSVCMGALPPRTLNVYLLMTLLMTLMPFAMLGMGLWFWSKANKNAMVNAELGHERN